MTKDKTLLAWSCPTTCYLGIHRSASSNIFKARHLPNKTALEEANHQQREVFENKMLKHIFRPNGERK
jgi:hypothetical protein